jgi:hypothetical protein
MGGGIKCRRGITVSPSRSFLPDESDAAITPPLRAKDEKRWKSFRNVKAFATGW